MMKLVLSIVSIRPNMIKLVTDYHPFPSILLLWLLVGKIDAAQIDQRKDSYLKMVVAAEHQDPRRQGKKLNIFSQVQIRDKYDYTFSLNRLPPLLD